MKTKFDLSLILACYNEEPLFSQSVQQIIEILDYTRFSYEIIFVDDCSSDCTRELILQTIKNYPQVPMRYLFHERNVGRGGTVTDGFRLSHGNIIGYIDIDLEVHARYIPACILAVQNGYSIATAYRIYKFHWRSVDRYLMSKGYAWIMRKLLKVKLQDTETGFKFFKKKDILPILDEIQDQGWFWDTECMVRAYRRGLSIQEIPCLFLRRFDKISSVHPFRDTLDYFAKLWKFKKELRNI